MPGGELGRVRACRGMGGLPQGLPQQAAMPNMMCGCLLDLIFLVSDARSMPGMEQMMNAMMQQPGIKVCPAFSCDIDDMRVTFRVGTVISGVEGDDGGDDEHAASASQEGALGAPARATEAREGLQGTRKGPGWRGSSCSAGQRRAFSCDFRRFRPGDRGKGTVRGASQDVLSLRQGRQVGSSRLFQVRRATLRKGMPGSRCHLTMPRVEE